MPIDINKDSPQIALKKLKARESVLRQFEAIAGLGSWEVDLKTKKSTWSAQSYAIYGIQEGSDVNIDTFFSMLLPKYLPKAKEQLAQAMQNGTIGQLSCKIKRTDGAIRDILVNARVIYDDEKNPLKLLGTTQDITEIVTIKQEYQKQAQLLEYQAYHDALTGLPNRVLFEDRLTQSIAFAKRHEQKFALLFLDLDQFKKINDSLGHHVGDKVLIEVANRFRDILRAEDTIARLGGDEFTIILRNIQDERAVAKVAQKLINSLKEPLFVAQHTLHISTSVGISLFPNDSSSEEDLLKYADAAMYKAKDEERNNFQFYSVEMTKDAFNKVVMENSLRVAIAQKEFEVYFQPQYDTKEESIVGMEAFVRWVHPHAGIHTSFGVYSPCPREWSYYRNRHYRNAKGHGTILQMVQRGIEPWHTCTKSLNAPTT